MISTTLIPFLKSADVQDTYLKKLNKFYEVKKVKFGCKRYSCNEGLLELLRLPCEIK